MFLRAVLAFLALPGVVAGLVPLLLLRWQPPASKGWPVGWGVGVLGLVILFACVRTFYVAGKGTLAPWSPPKHLVTSGLYRYSRNPMYIGVLLILAGWALVTGAAVLGYYALVVAVAFHLRVLLYEEPVLARLFGAAWKTYNSAVRRWF